MLFLKRLYFYAMKQLLGDGVINFRGRGIINLIDVGSAGHLPSPWKENAHKINYLLKFEPRDKSEQTPHVVTLDTALWEINCDKDLYIYKGFGGTGSSLFQQNYEYVSENFEELRGRGPRNLADTWFERSQLDKVEKISCRTLDDVLVELNQSFPYHFLKIDAQGAEYEILKGAEKFLRQSCIGIHLELFTVPLYKGIKLFSDVEAYLAGFEFDLAKKFPSHGSFDSQNDCLFIKRSISNKVSEVILKVYNV
jgi:hypothetical protein